MSIGCAVKIAVGKKRKDTLYIQLKNGAVYRHPETMNPSALQGLVGLIKEQQRRVQLRHWVKVR